MNTCPMNYDVKRLEGCPVEYVNTGEKRERFNTLAFELEDQFDLPAGYELLKAKRKDGTVDGGPIHIILARRNSAYGYTYVTWNYNDRSKCYWGHYFMEDQVSAEKDFELRD